MDIDSISKLLHVVIISSAVLFYSGILASAKKGAGRARDRNIARRRPR